MSQYGFGSRSACNVYAGPPVLELIRLKKGSQRKIGANQNCPPPAPAVTVPLTQPELPRCPSRSRKFSPRPTPTPPSSSSTAKSPTTPSASSTQTKEPAI